MFPQQAPAPNGAPAAQPGGMQSMANPQEQNRLTPEEWQELDSYITPRFVELVSKIDPQAGAMLAPFVQHEIMEDPASAAGMGADFPVIPPRGMGGTLNGMAPDYGQMGSRPMQGDDEGLSPLHKIIGR